MIRFDRSTKLLRLMWNCFYIGTDPERKERLNLMQLPLYHMNRGDTSDLAYL